MKKHREDRKKQGIIGTNEYVSERHCERENEEKER